MKLEIHIHTYNHADDRVITKLNIINKKLNQMPTKADFQQVVDRFSAALTNIADDIRRLTEQLQTGGLTEAEETEIFSQLNAIADRAEGIAAQTTEPTPPTEPTTPA